ncbi:FeoB-associated Cys-rich membrane protein [Testudinibacter sp. TR-2022]|nr:FeoB-associated Cys-rich membrane protein [Testudinibacter sp. TR-2022]
MQVVIVALIVIAAAAYLGKKWFGKKPSSACEKCCGCGRGKNCQ